MRTAPLHDELFLLKNARHYKIDPRLPIRIQKRELLSAIGFPTDTTSMKCRANDTSSVQELFRSFCRGGFPFLIIVSEPSRAVGSPLFRVEREDYIRERTSQGEHAIVDWTEAYTHLAAFPEGTWLEYARDLWSGGAVGGRLLYSSQREQLLEMQSATRPAAMFIDQRIPSFFGNIRDFSLSPEEYSICMMGMQHRGYVPMSFEDVTEVCEALGRFRNGFRSLLRIAELPTLEFGYTKADGLIAIDIDWPSQWKM